MTAKKPRIRRTIFINSAALLMVKKIIVAFAILLSGVANAQGVITPITLNGQTYNIQAVFGNYQTYQTQTEAAPWYNLGTRFPLFEFRTRLVPSDTSYSLEYNTVTRNPANNYIYLQRFSTLSTVTPLYKNYASTNVTTGVPFAVPALIDASQFYWWLILAPSTADTQQSLINSASVLQGTFTLQNSVLANSLNYDCSLFGKNDVCVSAGGRNTAVQAANGLNNTSGLLIASYRLNKNNSRIGAYVDQNLSVTGPGTVQLGNNTPLIGLFGVWSERPDGVGAEVKVSAAYGQKSTTVNRQVIGTSEAGSGGSDLISQGAQVVGKYGFAVLPDTVVSPYIGIRYTQNNMGGYTEATSTTVIAPLTYEALNTNATTALAGAKVRYRGIPKTTLLASAGVETDTNTANGSYNATNTSIGTLTPINFNPNPVRTRPTATLGAFYDVAKNQRLGVTGIYRQEPFQAVSTTTVMATYTVGL